MLDDLTQGHPGEADDLLPLVYDELRRLAGHYLRGDAGCPTLDPTALVHELYLRLAGNGARSCTDRAEFMAVAARAMRHLIIDHARRRRAQKRGGGRRGVSLDEVSEPFDGRDEYVMALDDALRDLADVDAELSRVVELRFFGGLTVQETAAVLGVAPVTVKRMWRLAKGWLHRHVTNDGGDQT